MLYPLEFILVLLNQSWILYPVRMVLQGKFPVSFLDCIGIAVLADTQCFVRIGRKR